MKKNIAILITSILLHTLQPHTANAAGQLHNLSDVINANTLLGATEHYITFTLPQDSLPIHRTDYIQIYFPDFTDVTAPTKLSGDFSGEPVFSVDGKYAKITGIRIMPSGFLAIRGINATNPPTEEQFQIIVMVTEDEAGTQVKNIANAMATINRGSVSVSASIPRELSGLVISGSTAPMSFLVFTENESVIGTDVANPTGGFSKAFSGLQPATHNITFYGIDAADRTTTPIPISIYTPAYQETLISNQLLSPTIEIDASQYLQGDSIIATGSAMPSGDITLLTDSPLRSYTTTASSSGEWTYTIPNSDEYVPGDYRIYAIVQNNFGLQSLTSPSVLFSIRTEDQAGTPCGDISGGDLNCDGSVNLTDFSILMYYWGSTNPAADINADGLVDITDFSILMFYWGS